MGFSDSPDSLAGVPGNRLLFVAPLSAWMTEQLIPALRHTKFSVDVLNVRTRTDTSSLGSQIVSATKKLQEHLRSSPRYDVIFSILYDDQIDPTEYGTLTKGSLRINYHVDVPQEWWRARRLAAIVDITLVAQEENSRYLKSAGGKLIYMPLGCNEPDTKCLREDVATDYGRILFFGSAHSRIRYHLLNSLARQNISIACMGAGWHEPNEQTKVHPRRGYEYTGWLLNQQLPSLHYRILTSGMAPVLGGILNRVLPWPKLSTRVELLGEVRREEVNAYLSRSFANVSTAIHGSGWMLRRPMFQVKLRDFEIPTFPRPYVTSSFPEIAKFFVPDDEIVVYSSNAELADKIRQLQSNPALAARIGAQGSDRVRRDHTWDRRLADLSRQAAIPEMRPV